MRQLVLWTTPTVSVKTARGTRKTDEMHAETAEKNPKAVDANPANVAEEIEKGIVIVVTVATVEEGVEANARKVEMIAVDTEIETISRTTALLRDHSLAPCAVAELRTVSEKLELHGTVEEMHLTLSIATELTEMRGTDLAD